MDVATLVASGIARGARAIHNAANGRFVETPTGVAKAYVQPQGKLHFLANGGNPVYEASVDYCARVQEGAEEAVASYQAGVRSGIFALVNCVHLMMHKISAGTIRNLMSAGGAGIPSMAEAMEDPAAAGVGEFQMLTQGEYAVLLGMVPLMHRGLFPSGKTLTLLVRCLTSRTGPTKWSSLLMISNSHNRLLPLGQMPTPWPCSIRDLLRHQFGLKPLPCIDWRIATTRGSRHWRGTMSSMSFWQLMRQPMVKAMSACRLGQRMTCCMPFVGWCLCTSQPNSYRAFGPCFSPALRHSATLLLIQVLRCLSTSRKQRIRCWIGIKYRQLAGPAFLMASVIHSASLQVSAAVVADPTAFNTELQTGLALDVLVNRKALVRKSVAWLLGMASAMRLGYQPCPRSRFP